jgi:Family of unknown function (DUF5995)
LYPRKFRLLLGVLTTTAMLATGVASGSAVASDPIFIGWSQLLPAWAFHYSPSSQDACESGQPSCVKRTLQNMERRYTPLADACDHNAVFALAYLRTTEEYQRTAATSGALDDPAFVNHEDAVFAQFYFTAYDAWAAGNRSEVPAAWQIAFDAAKKRQVSGSGNIMLGMNAHVNRDLPFVLAGIGLVKPDGTSRKPDHDRINAMLNRVVGPLLAEESARFDPTIDDIDSPYHLSYTALMQILVSWRETAWRNAERLVAAPDAAARAAVAADIENYAASTARSIVLSYQYNPPVTTSAARDAYCASQTP